MEQPSTPKHTSITKTRLGDLDIYELCSGTSNAQITTFGAQVISWSIAGNNILFSNPKLVTDKSKPLRAGAPICFPWFNKGLNWNLGKEITPSHGAARSSDWALFSEQISQESVSIAFDFETKSHLDLPLRISVNYLLNESSLLCQFKVENLVPDASNAFELALHSYFATPEPESTQIHGLRDYKDTYFIPKIPIDQIFENAGNKLNAKFKTYTLEIENNGFQRSVIWHPGLTQQLADLAQDVSPVPFLCLESLTEKIELSATSSWLASVCYGVKLS